ncbi:VOC family protein [Taibaiella soli]|uniref:VOC family protein n=1 Tax=Taibaiella soli TaxID=1649169 RepID=A0A2W2ADU5_9BACT|nr:VOC family protein [Taibaiella soli]PZF71722.1 VOC family protein [Taibaiella soli]
MAIDKLNIPPNNQVVMPYLILHDAAGFLAFTEAILGARLLIKHMRTETIIQHAEIIIGDSTIMFAEATQDYPPQPAGLFIYVTNVDETYKKALDAGAKSISQPADQEYGRSCGVIDPSGNTWWITTVLNKA